MIAGEGRSEAVTTFFETLLSGISVLEPRFLL